jgi:hypothetical protein
MRSYRKDLARYAREHGWTIELTRGNHLRLQHAKVRGGVIAPQTPSDWRVFRNTLAKLRRALRQEVSP